MEWRRVLVEMRVPRRASAKRVRELAGALVDHGFDPDPDYLVPSENSEETTGRRSYRHVLLRGQVAGDREPELEAQPNVVHIWTDAPLEPISAAGDEESSAPAKSPFTF